MDSIYGYKIIIAPDVPRVQCSPEFVRLQAPELVAETNAWMLGFFGTSCIIPDGQVITMDSERTMAMSQRGYDLIRKSTQKANNVFNF